MAQTDIDVLYLGEDKALIYTVYQNDETTVQDITGFALSWLLKRDPDDAGALITKTTGSGINLTTPASGICTVTVLDTDTDGLDAGDYWHELKRTDANSETILSQRRIRLRRSLHRS